jgi:hypothetical protein
MFVDPHVKETVALVLAEHFGLPFAERDVFLDNEFGADAVVSAKGSGERRRKYGYAVAIGHPHAGLCSPEGGYRRSPNSGPCAGQQYCGQRLATTLS